MEKMEKIPVFADFAKVRGRLTSRNMTGLVAGLLPLTGKIVKNVCRIFCD